MAAHGYDFSQILAFKGKQYRIDLFCFKAHKDLNKMSGQVYEVRYKCTKNECLEYTVRTTNPGKQEKCPDCNSITAVQSIKLVATRSMVCMSLTN